MWLRETNLKANSKAIAQINIRCGTYKGDALCRFHVTQPISQNVNVEPGSEVEWPSATSYTWTISKCRVGVNGTLTHWSPWSAYSEDKNLAMQHISWSRRYNSLCCDTVHKIIYLFIGLYLCGLDPHWIYIIMWKWRCQTGEDSLQQCKLCKLLIINRYIVLWINH